MIHPCLIAVLCGCCLAGAAEPPIAPAKPATAPAAIEARRSVAVLSCDVGETRLIDFARALPELVATTLGQNRDFQLLERTRFDQVLKEQGLGTSGLADPDQVARIGRLLGARILVMLRVYRVDDQLFVTARAVEVESGRMIPVTKTMSVRDAKPVALAVMVCADLTERIRREFAAGASPDEDAETTRLIAEIRQAIGDGPLPRITIAVPEENLHRPVPDPAVKTELAYLMRKLGFRVLENDSALLDQWVKDQFAGKAGPFPADIGDIDVVIYGGAVAETVGQAGNLVSSRARLELSAISVGSGELVAIQARTASAADLSGPIAAKSAMQKAGRALAKEFISELVKGWRNRADKAPKDR